jgi:multidrug transporter EmrE-like cation transporter
MSTLEFVPLLRAPDSWPTWLVGAVAMIALAALDIAGALAAKQWVATSNVGPLLLGSVAFLLLFWVYASALQYAELALVTMGWIVVLQVGLLLIDRFLFGVHLDPAKWVAVVVILVAQGYLVLGPRS